MSIWTIKGTAEQPIPRHIGKAKTRYKIVSLPSNLKVVEGIAQRAISADLDPGKYRLIVTQFLSGSTGPDGNGKATRMKWRKDFYHDIPGKNDAEKESVCQRLNNAPLMFTKGFLTTEGTSFNCQLPGCFNEATSRLAAILHEASHSGADLLNDTNYRPGELPPPKVSVDSAVAGIQAEKAAGVNRLREAALGKQE